MSRFLLNLRRGEHHHILAVVEQLSAAMATPGHVRVDLLELNIVVPYDRSWKVRVRAAAAMLRKAGFGLVFVDGPGNYTFVRRA